MRIVDQAGTTDWLTFTTCNDVEFSSGSHGCSFVSGEQSGQELVATGSRTGREVRGRPAAQMGPETSRGYQQIENDLNTNLDESLRMAGPIFPDSGLFGYGGFKESVVRWAAGGGCGKREKLETQGLSFDSAQGRLRSTEESLAMRRAGFGIASSLGADVSLRYL